MYSLAYTCKTCSKSFAHLRILTADSTKKFICEKCKELFTPKDALKRHERRHQEAAIHTCGNRLKNYIVGINSLTVRFAAKRTRGNRWHPRKTEEPVNRPV